MITQAFIDNLKQAIEASEDDSVCIDLWLLPEHAVEILKALELAESLESDPVYERQVYDSNWMSTSVQCYNITNKKDRRIVYVAKES